MNDIFIFLSIASGIWILSYIFKSKGIKGAVFGGKIIKTFGELEFEDNSFSSNKILIHSIERKSESALTIEFVQKGFLSYRMNSITLSQEEARQLSSIMNSAINEIT